MQYKKVLQTMQEKNKKNHRLAYFLLKFSFKFKDSLVKCREARYLYKGGTKIFLIFKKASTPLAMTLLSLGN